MNWGKLLKVTTDNTVYIYTVYIILKKYIPQYI